MPTVDGRTRLYQVIQQIAGGLDRHNALKGTGVIVLFGLVLAPLPDLKVSLEGMTQLSGGDALYLTADNLLIPDDMRLAVGDRIALMPVRAENSTKFMVNCKIRTTDIQPVENTRMGFNGDINNNPNGFVGVEVQVQGDNENHDSVLLVQGDRINLVSRGGAQIYIDGINFHNHAHHVGAPVNGDTGSPH